MPTVAELSVNIDADDKATATIERLDALLRELGTGQTEVAVDATGVAEAENQVHELQGTLFDLENNETTATVNLADDQAKAEASAFKAQLDRLAETITSRVDLNVGTARAELAALKEQLASIQDGHASLDLDTAAAFARIAELEAALKAIPDETVTVEVDKDGKGKRSISGLAAEASRASIQVNALATAILALGAALVPIAAVGVAGVLALGAGFVAAGAGAVLFGALAVNAMSPIMDVLKKAKTLQDAYNTAVTDKQKEAALEKLKALYASLDPQQLKVVQGIQKMQTAWDDLTKVIRPQIFQIAGTALDFIAQTLPKMSGFATSMAGAVQTLETRLIAALTGPFWTQFFSNMARLGGPILVSLGTSFGNIIQGIAGIINAFTPFSVTVTQGFEDMTKKFSDWGTSLATNPGFKAFIAYVQENTPNVISLIKSLWGALVQLVESAAPIGSKLVAGLKVAFDFIAALGRTHPDLLAIVLVIVAIGVVLLNLLGPIATIISLAGSLAAAITAVGLPVIAVIAGIVLLAAALVAAYVFFEPFRNAVNSLGSAIGSFVSSAIPAIVSAFHAVVGAIQVAWAWLVQTFGPAVSTVVAFVVSEFNKMVQWGVQNIPLFLAAWNNIRPVIEAVFSGLWTVISAVLSAIVAIWNSVWPGLVTILKGVWTAISGVISGALQIVRGIIQVWAGLLAGDWSAVWGGLFDILAGIFTAIWGFVSGAFGILQGIVQQGTDVINAIWSAAWQFLVDVLSGPINSVIDIFQHLFDVLVGNSIIPDLVNAIISWFTTAAAFITSIFLAPIQAAIAIWQTLYAGVSAIVSTLVSVVTVAFNALVAIGVATWNAISSGAQAAWALITSVVQAAIAVVTSVIQSGMALAQSVALAAWSAISSAAQTAWSTITSLVSSAISTVVSVVTNGVNNLVNAWRSGWTNMLNAVTQGIASIVSAVTGLGNQIVSIIASIGGRMAAAGASLMSNLASGIISSGGAVIGAVTSVINAAVAKLPGSPAKTGPLSGQGYALLRGQRFSADLARGIGDGLPRIADLATSISYTLAGVTPAGAGSGIGLPAGGGATVQVAAGAVQVMVAPGDVDAAKAAFSGAGDDLSAQIMTALRRR